ncbi:uncharacterized protein MELLADRAFT_108595 [Melampsora larici-populina 98AG31]|uniref:Uncharacterized protein n=1 Tax=Melampsora larici-populina (strain 98AG31 / pathotype 3-4-7) TaxID=747676 RepID=F4RTL7_MELLP|nr:uncharacterized protein MELLADRAFT_108595 [Melampsora larici-populina 98AG31]EGG04317.1 hypothetical protein MELLADRAFT_108595 [Melampsora larici-populina 98AG31]
MPFNLPSNFCPNPDIFLRKFQSSEPVESPPAPAPPRYNWPIEGDDVDTPEKTIRTIIPSSSHTLTSVIQPEPTLTPDARIVREFFHQAHLATPVVPGGFVHTPMQQSPAESSRRVSEIQNTDAMTQDDIINTLQLKINQLQQEKSEWEAKAQASAFHVSQLNDHPIRLGARGLTTLSLRIGTMLRRRHQQAPEINN